MSRTRAFALFLLLASFGALPACGDDPPDKEIAQAEGAIDAARAAGADVYAREEFAAAQESLKRSRDAVVERDYRLALTHAIDSRERAQNAAKEASDLKAGLRADAERGLVTTTALIADVKARIKAAEGRAPARLLNDARTNVSDAETAVQEARAALGRGEFAQAAQTLQDSGARLTESNKGLEAVLGPPARRRR
jgi:hypothetical protein